MQSSLNSWPVGGIIAVRVHKTWWPKYHCAAVALIISMRGQKIKIHMGDGCSPSPNTCCLLVEVGLENTKP